MSQDTGSIWICTDETYDEVIERMLFGDKTEGWEPKKNIPIGSTCFLFNSDGSDLHGPFEIASEIGCHETAAWPDDRGVTRFPVQVRIRTVGQARTIRGARPTLKAAGIVLKPMTSGKPAPTKGGILDTRQVATLCEALSRSNEAPPGLK